MQLWKFLLCTDARKATGCKQRFDPEYGEQYFHNKNIEHKLKKIAVKSPSPAIYLACQLEMLN